MLIALQGAVGLDQYETHLPTQLVWVHVALACASWLACLWATCAAGRLRAHMASVRVWHNLGDRSEVQLSSPAVSLRAEITPEKGVQ